jgi:hypothetical protein
MLLQKYYNVGSDNTAIGRTTLVSTTTGSNNTAVGSIALQLLILEITTPQSVNQHLQQTPQHLTTLQLVQVL